MDAKGHRVCAFGKFAGVGGNVIYNKMLESRHTYNTTVGFQRGGVFGGMSAFSFLHFVTKCFSLSNGFKNHYFSFPKKLFTSP